jgi:hypothetical protein
MPLSYDFIEKPSQVLLVDQFFSGSEEALRNAYKVALSILDQHDEIQGTTSYLASESIGPLAGFTEDDAGHFRQHWLDPEQGLHPWSGPEVGDVMHRAYRHAIETASQREVAVPIETFWVFSPVERLEMRVSESDHQITVFVLIPKTDEITFGDQPAEGSRITSFGPDTTC